MRPGCETTRVGWVAPVRRLMSYVTGIVSPLATVGTIGASTLGVLPSVGPNVSEKRFLRMTCPLADALYTRGTVCVWSASRDIPAAARITPGWRRAHGVVASRLAGPVVAASRYVTS